jgi:chorismate synthase
VRSIGAVEVPGAEKLMPGVLRTNAEMLSTLADRTTTRALTESDSNRLVAAIDEAQARRDTLGGVLEVVVTGVPIGLGSHAQFDRKLDGRLSQALLSLPAFKAVELGDGWAAARQFGSEVHDPIVLEREGKRLGRSSNHAGGLEAGITNGQPLVLRCAMKPIATVPAALPSVHLGTLQPTHAHVERSDTCAVPAAGVIAEAVVALELADALLEVLGGDTLASLRMPFARMRVSSRISPGHIFLVGPMGVGKSTVGAAIASRCRLPFIDLDARIEKRLGVSVAEFFAREGEPAFRDRENEELILVESEAPSVVALGGGAVLRPSNWQVMRDAGVVVHLDADPETLLERLRAENVPLERRPLLAGADPLERLRTLARERHHAYARADLHLDTRGLDAQQVADAAIGLIRSIQGPLTVRARSLGASREDGS